jgi:hypothetical protein
MPLIAQQANSGRFGATLGHLVRREGQDRDTQPRRQVRNLLGQGEVRGLKDLT